MDHTGYKSIFKMKYWIFFLGWMIPITLTGQAVLPIQEAVAIALEQNFAIQVAELVKQADSMQVYKANAGIGPIVDWNAGFNATGNNVNQNFTDGRVISRWGRAVNPFTNISVGINLYDGGRMKATYDRLGLLSERSETEGKLIIQNTVVDVMQTYYEIRRQQETVEYLRTIIEYYQERLKITEERWKVGKGSKIDFLQSQIDLNAQLSELSRAENNLQNGKVILNGLLNRDPLVSFDTEAIPKRATDYNLANLVDQATRKNWDMVLLQKTMAISLQEEALVEADRKPQVALNGSVGYNYNNTNAGFLLSNRSFFANAGLVARWNLFDGGHRKNQIAISKVNSAIILTQQEELRTQIINELTIAYNQYNVDRELLAFEEQNQTLAEENLAISLEKFRLGGSSILELIEVQRAYDTALNRLVNAQYNILVSELQLLLLSGSLVN